VIHFGPKTRGENICSVSYMFRNWGHFDLRNAYPGGWEAVRKISQECRKNGNRTTMYPLSDLLKTVTIPEPYIMPRVDPLFARYEVRSRLLRDLDEKARKIAPELRPELRKLLGQGRESRRAGALLLIENEIIYLQEVTCRAAEILLRRCRRGYLRSLPKAQRGDTPADFLYFAGYQNLFPGDFSMSHEVALRNGRRARRGATLDGHESCLESGLGFFAMNDTPKTIYVINRNQDLPYTQSRLTAYGWHIIQLPELRGARPY